MSHPTRPIGSHGHRRPPPSSASPPQHRSRRRSGPVREPIAWPQRLRSAPSARRAPETRSRHPDLDRYLPTLSRPDPVQDPPRGHLHRDESQRAAFHGLFARRANASGRTLSGEPSPFTRIVSCAYRPIPSPIRPRLSAAQGLDSAPRGSAAGQALLGHSFSLALDLEASWDVFAARSRMQTSPPLVLRSTVHYSRRSLWRFKRHPSSRRP